MGVVENTGKQSSETRRLWRLVGKRGQRERLESNRGHGGRGTVERRRQGNDNVVGLGKIGIARAATATRGISRADGRIRGGSWLCADRTNDVDERDGAEAPRATSLGGLAATDGGHRNREEQAGQGELGVKYAITTHLTITLAKRAEQSGTQARTGQAREGTAEASNRSERARGVSFRRRQRSQARFAPCLGKDSKRQASGEGN